MKECATVQIGEFPHVGCLAQALAIELNLSLADAPPPPGSSSSSSSKWRSSVRSSASSSSSLLPSSGGRYGGDGQPPQLIVVNMEVKRARKGGSRQQLSACAGVYNLDASSVINGHPAWVRFTSAITASNGDVKGRGRHEGDQEDGIPVPNGDLQKTWSFIWFFEGFHFSRLCDFDLKQNNA